MVSTFRGRDRTDRGSQRALPGRHQSEKASSICAAPSSVFVQGVLRPTDRPTGRQEARTAEAVQASDLLFHCRDDRI